MRHGRHPLEDDDPTLLKQLKPVVNAFASFFQPRCHCGICRVNEAERNNSSSGPVTQRAPCQGSGRPCLNKASKAKLFSAMCFVSQQRHAMIVLVSGNRLLQTTYDQAPEVMFLQCVGAEGIESTAMLAASQGYLDAIWSPLQRLRAVPTDHS